MSDSSVDRPHNATPKVASCPVREHTGDGVYVGRCDFGLRGGVCPRCVVADYLTLDDRDVPVARRRMPPPKRSRRERVLTKSMRLARRLKGTR